MKTILILAVALCGNGCIGYHAELRKEQQAEYNLNLACTNLINSLNAMSHSESLTNYLNKTVRPMN